MALGESGILILNTRVVYTCVDWPQLAIAKAVLSMPIWKEGSLRSVGLLPDIRTKNCILGLYFPSKASRAHPSTCFDGGLESSVLLPRPSPPCRCSKLQPPRKVWGSQLPSIGYRKTELRGPTKTASPWPSLWSWKGKLWLLGMVKGP